jgi:SAM-dependent methyltransferase
MTGFELKYRLVEPFVPPLHRQVRRRLLTEVAKRPAPVEVLDVGGRKSHYTIGVPARITISDLPRESDVQHQLHLGITDDIMAQTLARRSNVQGVVYDDMTTSKLPDAKFELVVAVEVLEHVEQDEDFVAQVQRVLKPGGCFIMTTPNGDSVANTNPDHKRHYRRAALHELLARHFRDVELNYAVPGGVWRRWGLQSWSPRRPFRTGRSMFANVVNGWQASRSEVGERMMGTRHLFACASK